jgi:hypothetical protein
MPASIAGERKQFAHVLRLTIALRVIDALAIRKRGLREVRVNDSIMWLSLQ